MQQHHIDPIDVHPPQYCPEQIADEPRQPALSHRLRQLLFQASLFSSLIPAVYLILVNV